MMNAIVKQLLSDGFKVTEKRRDATYMAKGADERVIMQDGVMKRGKPRHRRA